MFFILKTNRSFPHSTGNLCSQLNVTFLVFSGKDCFEQILLLNAIIFVFDRKQLNVAGLFL
jgi:hypothetical protein